MRMKLGCDFLMAMLLEYLLLRERERVKVNVLMEFGSLLVLLHCVHFCQRLMTVKCAFLEKRSTIGSDMNTHREPNVSSNCIWQVNSIELPVESTFTRSWNLVWKFLRVKD